MVVRMFLLNKASKYNSINSRNKSKVYKKSVVSNNVIAITDSTTSIEVPSFKYTNSTSTNIQRYADGMVGSKKITKIIPFPLDITHLILHYKYVLYQ